MNCQNGIEATSKEGKSHFCSKIFEKKSKFFVLICFTNFRDYSSGNSQRNEFIDNCRREVYRQLRVGANRIFVL